MEHVSEYANPADIRALSQEIARRSQHPMRIMEVCGGQTHAIMRHGLDTLLPPPNRMEEGPGGPRGAPAARRRMAVSFAAPAIWTKPSPSPVNPTPS